MAISGAELSQKAYVAFQSVAAGHHPYGPATGANAGVLRGAEVAGQYRWVFTFEPGEPLDRARLQELAGSMRAALVGAASQHRGARRGSAGRARGATV